MSLMRAQLCPFWAVYYWFPSKWLAHSRPSNIYWMNEWANILACLILKTTLKYRNIRYLPEVAQPVSSRRRFKPSSVTPKPVPFLQCDIASHRFPDSWGWNPMWTWSSSSTLIFWTGESKSIDSPSASQSENNNLGQESRSLNFSPG